jgi:AraC-like DNA-binding protein
LGEYTAAVSLGDYICDNDIFHGRGQTRIKCGEQLFLHGAFVCTCFFHDFSARKSDGKSDCRGHIGACGGLYPELCYNKNKTYKMKMTKPLFIRQSFRYHEFKPHFHDDYSIGIITEGKQKLHLGNDKKLVEKGQIRLINPGELHFVDKACEWSYANIIIPQKDVLDTAGYIYQKEFKEPICFKNHIDQRDLVQKFTALYGSLDRSMDFEERYIEFIEALLRDFSIYGEPKRQKLGNMHQVLEYIDAHFLDEIRLDELAAIAGVSKYHVIKLFKAKIGLTPHQYILRLRLNGAVSLIAKGVPFAEVAFGCGFSDQSHFIKEFKTIYGFTPSKLIRNQ